MPKLPNTLRLTLFVIIIIMLLVGGFVILRPFLTGIAWSIVIALVTWPLYGKMSRKVNPGLSATIMVLSVALVAVLIIVPIVSSFLKEVVSASNVLKHRLPEIRVQLQELTDQIPILSDLLGDFKAQLLSPSLAELESALSFASRYQETVMNVVKVAVGGVLGTIAQIIITFFTLFFLYYHGMTIGEELRALADSVFGDSSDKILSSVRETVRGAVYGVVVTAVAQGLLAGVGYAIAGAPVPILLAMVTALFSLIPMGTPFVYIPIVVYLALGGAWITGLVLLAWCIGVVSTIDNVIRPIFISQATNVSMALVFFGVLGGVLSFGLIGIFVGPVILVILQLLLRELTKINQSNTLTN